MRHALLGLPQCNFRNHKKLRRTELTKCYICPDKGQTKTIPWIQIQIPVLDFGATPDSTITTVLTIEHDEQEINARLSSLTTHVFSLRPVSMAGFVSLFPRMPHLQLWNCALKNETGALSHYRTNTFSTRSSPTLRVLCNSKDLFQVP